MRKSVLIAVVAALIVASVSLLVANAASHREAPAIAMDPEADITDFFMFRSYEPDKDDKVILIMDAVPGGEPSSGPNYFQFDPNVRYAFHIDNNTDGKAEDITFEFQFTNEIRGLVDQSDLFLCYVGGEPFPPITALDGPGSEGLGCRQKYSLTMVRDGHRQVLAEGLIAVPSNVGPRTMPDYEPLATQGIYELDHDVRVFAGQRGDPFYIDLGAVFDTLNLRRNPPALDQDEDANDEVNPFGIDMIGSFNVQTIALEVPASLLTLDGKDPDSTSHSKLGAYASTSRPKVTVLRGAKEQEKEEDSKPSTFVQVQRLANPLINEAIIGTEDKDHWNALDPDQEKRFLDYYLNPRLALALELVFGVPAASSERQDLVDLLLKYQPSDKQLSELLRLDLSVPPTPLEEQRRMTVLASPPDPAGWPNGRRPKDDVTDIAIRVVGGPDYTEARAGDGVNKHFTPTSSEFPFLATPQDGLNRQHENPPSAAIAAVGIGSGLALGGLMLGGVMFLRRRRDHSPTL
jgi:Domain of unknown function (DUF4331)